jgi:hypothetical protein
VVFSYVSKAVLRTDWKLEDEEAMGVLWDMGLVTKDQLSEKTMRESGESTGMHRRGPVVAYSTTDIALTISDRGICRTWQLSSTTHYSLAHCQFTLPISAPLLYTSHSP